MIAVASVLLLSALVLVANRGRRDAPAATTVGDRRLQPTANPAAARGKSGPNLVVDPADLDHIVELHQELVTEECEFSTSLDRGRTWKGGRLQAPEGYPAGSPGPCSVAGPSIGNIGQQSLAFGSGRTVYASWAATPQPMVLGSTVLISRSVDGGATFERAFEVPGMLGGVAPASDFSRPELVVERRTPATDRIYVASRDSRSNRAMVTRSDDGGATWFAPSEASSNSPVRNPPPGFAPGAATPSTSGDAYTVATQLTQPVLGPAPPGGGERALHVGWAAVNRGGPCPPGCESAEETVGDGYLVMATSTDLGQTWSRTRAVNIRGVVAPNAAAFRGPSFPRLAAGLDGGLYVVFTQGPGIPGSANCGSGPFPAGAPGAAATPCPAYRDPGTFRRADHTIDADADVWFLRSTDGGATWDGLRQINDPKRAGLAVPEITQTRHPQIAVAPSGRVDIVWEDRRHWYLSPTVRQSVKPAEGLGRCVQTHQACDEARLGDTYYAGSSDRGSTFSANRRVNDRSHDNDIGFDYRLSAYRDYGPNLAAVGPSHLLVADMDGRLGTPVTNSLDLFLRDVDLAPAAPTVTDHRVSGIGPFSVALSQWAQPGGSEAVLAGDGVTRAASHVVIVPDDDPATALVGGVLARASLGPVLASPRNGLSPALRAEVDRLDPVGAYVLGSTTQLAPQVEADLAATGIPAERITRIAAATPAELAAAVARTLDDRDPAAKASPSPVPAFDAVVVVNPASPSSAAAAALAANRRLPVLFVDATTVPPATAEALGVLGITRTLVVGGAATVGPTVEAALPGALRLGGDDPSATFRAVLGESVARGLPTNQITLVDGSQPMLPALMGAAIGRVGGLLLVVEGAAPSAAVGTLAEVGLDGRVDHLDTWAAF